MFGTNSFGWTSGGTGSGGGTIGGAITQPEVAFGSAANQITGDPTFTFSSTTKIMGVNNVQLNSTTLVGSPVNGLFEWDGNILYFTTNGTRYQVGLT
jgi:hypothetical protein